MKKRNRPERYDESKSNVGNNKAWFVKRRLYLGNCRNRIIHIHVYTYLHNTYTSVILDSNSGFGLNRTVPDNQSISISEPIGYFDGSITGRVRVFRFGFGFGSGLWIICPGLVLTSRFV